MIFKPSKGCSLGFLLVVLMLFHGCGRKDFSQHPLADSEGWGQGIHNPDRLLDSVELLPEVKERDATVIAMLEGMVSVLSAEQAGQIYRNSNHASSDSAIEMIVARLMFRDAATSLRNMHGREAVGLFLGDSPGGRLFSGDSHPSHISYRRSDPDDPNRYEVDMIIEHVELAFPEELIEQGIQVKDEGKCVPVRVAHELKWKGDVLWSINHQFLGVYQ